MSKTEFRISMAILLAVIGALIFLSIRKQETTVQEYDRVYPMVNQGIRWEGAGYSGVWEK